MTRALTASFRYELLVGGLMVVIAGVFLVVTSDLDARYTLAIVAAIGGSAFLAALPDRRVACLMLWVLIHPLGIEKIFLVDAAEGPQFTDPSIIFNASDGPLALLALFVVAETMLSGRVAFQWSRMTTILLALLAWSGISFAIHAIFLDDKFTTSAPYALIQDVRLLVFVLLVQSAIRSRGDIMLVLLAVAVAVLLQTMFVGLSYAMGHAFSYAGTAGSSGLQGFDTAGGAQLVRATGTFGQVNEQAIFHTIMTIPLIAFFGVRNTSCAL